MSKNQQETAADCPIGYALAVFGDRWTLLVLRDLMLNDKKRFRELLASPEGIATNILADRLKRLEGSGLIARMRDASDARQFIYSPTEAAIALVPVLLEIMIWSAKHGDAALDAQLAQSFAEDRQRCIESVQRSIRERSQAP